MGKTHYVTGALFTAAMAPMTSQVLGLDLSPAELVIGVGIGTIAGVLPDIDHPESLVTKGLLPGRKLFGGIGRYIGWFLAIPPRIVGVGARATMNHRGGTHSVTFMMGWTLLAAPMYALVIAFAIFLLSLVLGVLGGILPGVPTIDMASVVRWLVTNTPHIMPLVMVCVFWGYLAHLVSDSMTKVPVPWPWPFSKKRYFVLPKFLRFTTDSFTENRLVRPLAWLLFIIAFTWNIGVPLFYQGVDTAKANGGKSIIEHSSPHHKKQRSPRND